MRNPLPLVLMSAGLVFISMGAAAPLLAAPLPPQEKEFVPVTEEMLLDPDPADWLMVHRTYDLTGYSPLDQINQSNVGQLKLAWMRAMDVGPQELRTPGLRRRHVRRPPGQRSYPGLGCH